MLVDLVQQEQWIGRPRLAQVLDDLAGHGADVRPAVAANLGLVAHAAQRLADELPSRRAGDRAAKRCLAPARRTDEAQYRPDRKSGVSGKSVSVRVDPGGPRII